MTSAHVTVEHHDGELVAIALHGEIDLDNATGLGEQILRALPNTTVGAVLDLSDVTYLDSAAIRLLFELASTTRGHGQALRIVVPPGSLTREVLGHVALDSAVPIDPDSTSALTRIREGRA
jgi:stage II sporulation protein AA (anti-sigma F factor antagonist)